MKNKKISMVIAMLVIAMVVFVATQTNKVKAEGETEINVATAEQFVDALATIHGDINKSYVINLTDSFTLAESDSTDNKLTIDNGNNVTIKGNGNTITFSITGHTMLVVNGANLKLQSGDGTLTLKGTNGATESIIKVTDGTVDMYDGVTLSDNNGGAMHFACGGVRIQQNGTFNMHGGTIKNMNVPYTQIGGAAVNADQSGAKFNMTGGEISNCTCNAYAGALFASEDAEMNITGGTFKNNSAEVGGVISIQENAKLNFKNITFDSTNTATYGGVMCLQGGTTTIDNCTFNGNQGARGGVIYMQNEDPDTTKVTIKNSTFNNCRATQYGGGIFKYSGELEFKNNIVDNCFGQTWGGFIVNYDGPLTMEKNTVSGCEANSSGGVVYNRGTVTLTNNTFTGNGAASGGVVYNVGGKLTSTNNTMKSNVANNGGALYCVNRTSQGATLSVSDVTSTGDDITENEANYSGGICIRSGKADFSKSYIYNNKAENEASDIYIGPDVAEIKIMDAASMDKLADFDDKTVFIKDWYSDEEGNRFALNNYTEVVKASNVTAGTEYFLVAATNTPDEKRYIVKFDANGGTGEMEPQIFVIDEEANLNANEFTREGYKFVAWNTKEDGSGESYKNKQAVKNLTEENNGRVILYAQWEEGTEPEEDTDEDSEEQQEDSSSEKQSDGKIKTGDTIMKWTAILSIATVVLAVGIKNRKKIVKVKGKRFK